MANLPCSHTAVPVIAHTTATSSEAVGDGLLTSSPIPFSEQQFLNILESLGQSVHVIDPSDCMSAESTNAIQRSQVDLMEFIDWSGVECLIQSTSNSVVNALKQVKNMDKSWMLHDRSHRSYIQGIFQFLRFVDQVTQRKKWHRCPCRKCMCDIWQTRKKMEDHLSHRGMWNNYTIWTEHGEVDENDYAQVELQNLHESGPSRNIVDSSTNPTINLLHDVFPYASRYEMAEEEEGDDHATNVNEAIDNESPNINEGVDMSDYEKYNRLLAQAQIPLYDGC